jgi:hypothetical protein
VAPALRRGAECNLDRGRLVGKKREVRGIFKRAGADAANNLLRQADAFLLDLTDVLPQYAPCYLGSFFSR